jgi:hypothetical protein
MTYTQEQKQWLGELEHLLLLCKGREINNVYMTDLPEPLQEGSPHNYFPMYRYLFSGESFNNYHMSANAFIGAYNGFINALQLNPETSVFNMSKTPTK